MQQSTASTLRKSQGSAPFFEVTTTSSVIVAILQKAVLQLLPVFCPDRHNLETPRNSVLEIGIPGRIIKLGILSRKIYCQEY
jgi:hypothetical protein